MRGEITHQVERWDNLSESWIPLTYRGDIGSSLELSVMGSVEYCNGWVDGSRLHVRCLPPYVAGSMRYRVSPVNTEPPKKT